MNAETTSELDLRQFGRALRRRAWMLAGVSLGLAAIVFAWSAAQPDLYQAAAEVRVVSDVSANLFGNQTRTDSGREIANAVYLVESGTVRTQANEQLGTDRDLVSEVSVEQVEGTDIVRIRVVSRDPEVAAAAANAYANVFVVQRRDQIASAFFDQAEELRTAADGLNQRINDIDAVLALNPPEGEADSLRAQRADFVNQQSSFQIRAGEFEIEASLRSDGVQIVQSAVPPSSPFAPTPLRNAFVGFLVGLVMAVGLAILLEWLDNRISSTNEAERIVGVPVLGVVPFEGSRSWWSRRNAFAKKRPELVGASSVSTEAYRTLQTSLRFSSIGKQKRRIAITSSSGSEGKTTVCANLAKTLAEGGMRVVVISGDLRRPMIGQLLGVDESDKGLSSVLLGDASLSECLRRVDLDNGRSLALLPAGPLIQNPAALLSSPQFGELLDRIESAGVDFILVDCAPVLPVSDTLAITDHVDGVLVMAVAGRTKKGNLAETTERLRQVGADIVGVVLNGVVPGKGYYGYGYGYGYGAYESYSSHDRPTRTEDHQDAPSGTPTPAV